MTSEHIFITQNYTADGTIDRQISLSFVPTHFFVRDILIINAGGAVDILFLRSSLNTQSKYLAMYNKNNALWRSYDPIPHKLLSFANGSTYKFDFVNTESGARPNISGANCKIAIQLEFVQLGKDVN